MSELETLAKNLARVQESLPSTEQVLKSIRRISDAIAPNMASQEKALADSCKMIAEGLRKARNE